MALAELVAVSRSLEDAFFELTEVDGMTALLRAELLKLRTTRTFLALTGGRGGNSLLIAVLVSLLTEPTEESVLTDVFTTDTSGLFILVLAIVGITGEWRHRTITSSLLAAPDRLRFLAAKTLAFAAAGRGAVAADLDRASAVVGMAILSVARPAHPGARRAGRPDRAQRASRRRCSARSAWRSARSCATSRSRSSACS